MRAVVILGLIMLGGCLSYSTDDADPGVSMSVQRNENNGQRHVEATLTSIRGPIADWADLRVSGCIAPDEGPIEVPHEFVSCGWNIRVEYAATGQVLYATP